MCHSGSIQPGNVHITEYETESVTSVGRVLRSRRIRYCLRIAPARRLVPGGLRDLASEEDGASLKGLPVMLLPARDVSIVDTWHVGGGTGSHDFRVDEAFVPDARAANPGIDLPRDPGPWYRLPVVLALGIGLGPVALGMERGAVDTFVEVMGRKTNGTGARVGDRLTVQERLAQAEAVLRSARAFLYEAANDAWSTVSASRQLSDRQVALLRLANMHATASGCRRDCVIRAKADGRFQIRPIRTGEKG